MTISEAPALPSDPGALEKLDDAGLVSAIHDGHDQAFEVFYERYHGDVLSFCRHMLGNREDAEDAAQQTFLATYRHVRASSPPEHPRAWLYTVARNRCVTTLRGRRETTTDTLEPATEGLAEEVERRHELRALLGDLGRLPEEQRVALLLFEMGALDQAEIAETLGCPPNKVKALVYQARTTLTHRAEARDARCVEVREQLATLRGGALNSRALKHHLEICEGCREYRDEVRRQRRAFALILPVIPLAAAHGSVMSALGIGGGASHAAGGASNGAAGWVARAGRQAGKTGMTASGPILAGAVLALALVTGGHERQAAERLVPPAQAAVPAPHARPHKPVAHHAARKRPHHHRAVVHLAARPRPPVVVPPPAPKQPAVAPPQPKAPPPHKSPPKPAPKPVQPPPAPVVPTPAPPPPPPASSCHSSGQGGGNAWGHCKGTDGRPPPAEGKGNGKSK